MTSAALQGVFRSLRQYHGPAAPKREMDALYAHFLKPGDLAFDVGAHVGDRTSSFRRLGARVVALEPQPLLYRALKLIHGRDDNVSLLATAAAERCCDVALRINSANPTVSTASRSFIAVSEGQPGWEGQVWENEIAVPALSLDFIISKYGAPAFIKIDVEGFEEDVLRGLRTPVAALSFEFTTIARDVALGCLGRLAALGQYGFDIALGESQRLTLGRWATPAEISDFIINLPHDANSGDVYALRIDAA